MAFDIYSTFYMEQAIKEQDKVYSFIKDRYFGETAMFKDEKIYIDYDDGEGNLIAPFVLPRVGKAPMGRGGYATYELVPPYIAPSRPLSIDDTMKRRAGESLVNGMTPEQRARILLAEDLEFLDKAISRREEWMCINTMLDNACTMEHVGDKASKHNDLIAQFYDTGKNEGVFTPEEPWDVGTADAPGTWYKDVCKQAASLIAAGRDVADLVVGANVADLILSDPWMKEMLVNYRLNPIGEIDPHWQEEGVIQIAPRVNFRGTQLAIFCYEGTYQKVSGNTKTTYKYMPEDGAILAAPNTGKLSYGAVTQVELDQQTHTRTGTRVPKHNVNVESNQRETILTARPIASPKLKNAWRACRNVFSTNA